MNTTSTAVLLFAGLVVGALLGRLVRRYLPADHLSAESRDSVKLALGLVATMTALLLGLLVSSAKDSYDTARSEVVQMAAKVVFLDRVLALYGPEAAAARVEFHDTVADGIRRMWPETGSGQVAPNERMGDNSYATVQRLSPQNDTQRDLKTQAANLMAELGQLRSLLQAQSIPSISMPLLLALACWLVIIFFGFSLVAPPNTTTTFALVASAFSVACAVFLMLELDDPFAGPIRIPSAPITNVLNSLGK